MTEVLHFEANLGAVGDAAGTSYEPRFQGEGFCERDLKPMADYALMAALVFCEAAAAPVKSSGA